MEIKCKNCEESIKEFNFYKIVKEKLNEKTDKYESTNICKQCLKVEYSKFGIVHICKLYNLYYDYNLWNDTNKNYEGRDKIDIFIRYISTLSSLKQYIDKKFKDSVFVNKLEFSDILIPVKEKSDLDFINEDIEKLKSNIEKSINVSGDFNAHNKWMNCLRDALELRDKLEDKNKWKEFSSHYYEGTESIKGENEYISLWEQNGYDDIRNHRVFKVEKEIKIPKAEDISEIYKCISSITTCVSVIRNIEVVLEHSLLNRTSFSNILESISTDWNNISKEKQDKICLLMGGMRYKYYVPSMIECFK